jgi:hypothetical protein
MIISRRGQIFKYWEVFCDIKSNKIFYVLLPLFQSYRIVLVHTNDLNKLQKMLKVLR